jgi:hypothetical protein
MIRTMDQISSEEDTTALKSWVLNHALASADTRLHIRSLQKDYLSQEVHQTTGKTPQEVSELVLTTILVKFLEGDQVKNAVKDAYAIKMEITTLPTVITVFSTDNSPTSVAIDGNVIEDGGGEITARGMAWESFYNPGIDDQVVPGGTGSGVFTVTISGLEEGKTYYARAFATNSAGTAYGNCISFVAGAPSGIGAEEYCAIKLDMYPNPATDMVHIRFESPDPKSLVFTIYDLGGKVVLQEKLEQVVSGINTHSFEVSELTSGYYTCILEGNNFTHSRKRLVIIR